MSNFTFFKIKLYPNYGKIVTILNQKKNYCYPGPPSKKKNLDDSGISKTPVKSIQNSNSGSPAKSPAGVNRRNAVLFTRKKQKEETKPPNEVTDDKPETEVVSNKTDKKKKPIAAVQALQDDVLENQETELQGKY